MNMGHLTLLTPVFYLIVAAIVVVLLGVVAAKNPKGKIEHWAASHFLAPCLMVPALIFSGWVVYQSIVLTGKDIKSVSLFVMDGGFPQLVIDPFAAIFSFMAIGGTLIVMLISIDHLGEYQKNKAEYYGLLMFAACAASLAAAASDLIAVYLSIEFLSLVSYVLAAFDKTNRRSAEAGLKYFLYGATCSAIMLYGMSILFGITGGNTSFAAIANNFNLSSGLGAAASGAGWVAIMFTLVGSGFKLALVPFHFWAPDTYEGAPTPVSAFLSVVSKAAGLAVLIRFLLVIAIPGSPSGLGWYWILAALSAVSMFYGNLVAIPQKSMKRMLAYSSIAQIGYMLVGVLVAMQTFSNKAATTGSGASVHINIGGSNQPWDLMGVIIYMLAYLFMNLGAFGIAAALGRRMNSDKIEDYSGLIKTSPFFACSMAVFLLSLAGIPPTAGFLGKFFIFGSAIKTGILGHPELVVLAIFGVINSIISVFYYFNIVRLMFFMPEKTETKITGSYAINSAIILALVFTLGLVIFAKPVSDLVSSAVYNASPIYSHSQIQK